MKKNKSQVEQEFLDEERILQQSVFLGEEQLSDFKRNFKRMQETIDESARQIQAYDDAKVRELFVKNEEIYQQNLRKSESLLCEKQEELRQAKLKHQEILDNFI